MRSKFFLRTDNRAGRAGLIKASLPRSRDLIAFFRPVVSSKLLIEFGVREESADENGIVTSNSQSSGGQPYCKYSNGETYPSIIIVIEIKTDHITALRFSRRACHKVCACSSSVACFASNRASCPSFSSRSLSATFWAEV